MTTATKAPIHAASILVREVSRVGVMAIAGAISLLVVVPCADFTRNVVLARESAEPCPLDLVSPGLKVDFYTNYHHYWDEKVYVIQSGGYHAYGGPGGVFLRVGAGDTVLALEYPRCR